MWANSISLGHYQTVTKFSIMLSWHEDENMSVKYCWGLGQCQHCLVGGRVWPQQQGLQDLSGRTSTAWFLSCLCCPGVVTQAQQAKPRGSWCREWLWSGSSHSSGAYHIIKMSSTPWPHPYLTQEGIKLLSDTFHQRFKVTEVCNLNKVKILQSVLDTIVYVVSQAIAPLRSIPLNLRVQPILEGTTPLRSSSTSMSEDNLSLLTWICGQASQGQD